MDADREVRAADGTRAEAGRGASGQLGVRLGHERGGALVPCRDDVDANGLEALEEAKEALAGHGERPADAGSADRVGEHATDGHRLGRRGSTFGRRGSTFGKPGAGLCGFGSCVRGRLRVVRAGRLERRFDLGRL